MGVLAVNTLKRALVGSEEGKRERETERERDREEGRTSEALCRTEVLGGDNEDREGEAWLIEAR